MILTKRKHRRIKTAKLSWRLELTCSIGIGRKWLKTFIHQVSLESAGEGKVKQLDLLV